MRQRAWFWVLKCIFILLFALLLQPNANATTANDLSYCGGDGQRACCLLEAVPSCDSGNAETGEIFSSTFCAGFPDGICRSTNPNDKSFCGGEGQRACCLSEAFPSCDTGKIELPTIADPTACGGLPAGTCATPTPCGGEGERACTITEQIPSCDAGLIELAGCSGLDCGLSLGWCYKPTPCGAEGQRACCLTDRPTDCDAGLTQVGGVAGDATCGGVNPFAFQSLGTCVDMSKLKNPIAEPGTGWSSDGSPQTCSSKGYADLHVHMFAHLAHGGGVLSGTPYDATGGVNKALRMDYGTDLDLVKKDGSELIDPLFCDEDVMPFCGDRLFHGGHLITDEAVGVGTHEGPPGCLGFACGATSNFGVPIFSGWPTWRSTVHQQVYYKWLERAWRGGLRLMTQLAVTNEALCKGSKHMRGTDCTNEMAPVDAQINATYAFQDWLDTQSGGAGKGWFRIVKTPAEAQQVISDGKLAVVLGIEVANLFNCKKTGCTGKNDGETDIDYVKRKTDEYYNKGIRVIFPIHNFDNAFGGPATWQNAINAGNFVSEGAFWNPEDCPSGPNYGFKLSAFSGWIISFLGFGLSGDPIINSGLASCNTGGLTDLGKGMITYMMQKGIVVDVDHMSRKAFNDSLDIADAQHRPVIASHVQFLDLNDNDIRHERMRTAEQLQRIRNTGGMVAAMLKDDQADTDGVTGKHNKAYTTSPSGKVIKDDCRYSSKTFAQMYQYAVDKMQGPVAMGSDFNGVAGHVGPRFGIDGCGQNSTEKSAQGRANNKLQYPFTLPGFGTLEKQVTGKRTFDFNVDGLAHIGLLPDLVADMKKIGLSDVDLDPLMNSATGFVNVWKRAEGQTVDPNQLSQLGCQNVTVNADANCKATGVSVADAATQTTYGSSLSANPAAPYSLGQTIVTLSTTQSDQCGAKPGSCTGAVTVLDKTAPSITCPATKTAECTGASTIVEFNAPTIGSDNCGSSFFAGCSAFSGQGFISGSTHVTCFSSDDAQQDFGNNQPNVGSCNFDVNIVDTTKPKITCPSNVTAECTGNSSAPATPGAATATDICGGVTVTTHDAASFPMGTTTLTYTATDGANLTDSCTTKITVQDTTPPSITCPPTQTLECTANHSAPATPAAASGSDICAAVNVSKPAAGTFPLGTTTLTYTATDQAGLQTSCNSAIVVQDTTPPTITSVQVTPVVLETLWPPSHKMKTVTLAVTASDKCDTVAPVCTISQITSNEPIDGLGDGDTAPDWEFLGGLQANLRAERSGTGNGRIYTLNVTCTDQAGKQSVGSTIVTVPKSQ